LWATEFFSGPLMFSVELVNEGGPVCSNDPIDFPGTKKPYFDTARGGGAEWGALGPFVGAA